jgi:hypothetical protein
VGASGISARAFFLFIILNKKNAMTISTTRPSPPNTPPNIAPIGVLDLSLVSAVGVLDAADKLLDGVEEPMLDDALEVVGSSKELAVDANCNLNPRLGLCPPGGASK